MTVAAGPMTLSESNRTDKHTMLFNDSGAVTKQARIFLTKESYDSTHSLV